LVEEILARFKNMIRAIARITVSRGTGRGAALGIVRLRRPGTRISCAPHCGINSILKKSTESYPCI